MKPKKHNVGIIQKFKGYYLEDCECQYCKYYQGRKLGCTYKGVQKHKERGLGEDICCCEEEKLEAIAAGRIKRKRGSVSWDS